MVDTIPKSHFKNVECSGEMKSATAVVGTLTASTPIAKANVNLSVKREIIQVPLNAFAQLTDSTVYKGSAIFGRACTIKKVTTNCFQAPVVSSGAKTLKVLKGSSAGNTVLDAATKDITTAAVFTADTGKDIALTSTAADLAIPAGTPIYVEISVGVQSTPMIGAVVAIEVELDDA